MPARTVVVTAVVVTAVVVTAVVVTAVVVIVRFLLDSVMRDFPA
jgi:hypothetical protein